MLRLFKTFHLIPVVMICLLFFPACGKGANEPFDGTLHYASFRDVPGVTEDEIIAIEALQKQGVSFVYGMTQSTEAFEENGAIGGFSAIFCEWLTDLFGIPFKPSIYDWGDLFSGLKDGSIDFSGEITPTDDRRLTYHMTGPIAQHTLKYIRIKGSPPLSEINETRPPRFIFLEGAATYDQVLSAGIYERFEPVFARDFESVYETLENGEADAFLAENITEAVFGLYGDTISEDFFPMVYSPVSLATQKAALRPVIEVVQKALNGGDPRYLGRLYNQGQREFLRHNLFAMLTEEERAYIRDNPVVSFVAENDNYPVSFYNSREKQWQGIAFEVLSEIETLTGLAFRLVNDPDTDWYTVFQMLEDGRASMITELIYSEERKGRFLWPASAIITDDYTALLSKVEFSDISISEILYVKVGLHKGTAHTELFNNWFPNHENTVEYENLNDAFDALERGEVDMVITSQHQFLYLSNFRELPGYKINVAFERTFDSTFGFNKNETLLCSIIDKALLLIDTKGISGKWMRRIFDYRIKLAQARTPWLVGATALGFGLFLLFILFQKKRYEGRKLEALVQERTLELNRYQRDMENALDTARAANASKSVFLANMSHEIRTPMNSIMGFSELALDDEVPPRTRDYLAKIRTNAEWLLQIINDILDISKVESGKMELEHIPFDMHELFVSCRTLIMPKAIEKGITLYFYVEPSIGKMPLGDPTRLRQVLTNLLSNAVKFTNTGMIKLHAAIKEMKEKTVTMHFEVKDSGIGMTAGQIEKIFVPFAQADSGTTRQYGGTGLGLSITKNFIELMGGKLSVESTPGVGSKFSFDLTFDTVDVSADEILDKKILLDEIEKPVFEGEILLCEDNAMNQQVICEHLARVGLKTAVADNGKIGLDMVRSRKDKGKKQFDLIFMDMHMPVMDGIEAATRIIKLDVNVPIVAMTANMMTDDMEIYKISGMKDCVGKPFTSQELWRCLLKYLKPLSREASPTIASPKKALQNGKQIEEDEEFGKEIRELFVRNNKGKYAEIVSALKAEDIDLAHRLVHSLKGNAGQIGEAGLREIAGSMEQLLKNGKNLVTADQMVMLETELNAVLSRFALPPGESGASRTSGGDLPVTDAEKARELFDRLEPLLKGGNTECLNFLDDLRDIPGCGQIIQQINDFDFESALSTLTELKKGWY